MSPELETLVVFRGRKQRVLLLTRLVAGRATRDKALFPPSEVYKTIHTARNCENATHVYVFTT